MAPHVALPDFACVLSRAATTVELTRLEEVLPVFADSCQGRPPRERHGRKDVPSLRGALPDFAHSCQGRPRREEEDLLLCALRRQIGKARSSTLCLKLLVRNVDVASSAA